MAPDSIIKKVASENAKVDHIVNVLPHTNEKDLSHESHVKCINTSTDDFIYDNIDEELELHARTYVAVGAVVIIYFIKVIALQGPPAVVYT